jgi:hypothetical protein
MTKMKLKMLLGLAALPLAAHADWHPIPQTDRYIVTLGATVNGYYGQITYGEDRWSGNYLPTVARDVYSITDALRNELNGIVREAAVAKGYTFTSGILSGEANVTLQPNGAGYLMTRLTGLSYVGTARGTERQGPISATCTASLHVRDIVATAQIGSAAGGIPEESVGMTAVYSSNANCSTNVDWIPIVGFLVNMYAEHEARYRTRDAARDAIRTMKDKLFFERDANAYAGLNRIVPADKVIPLPGGQPPFAVGQWLHNQLAWILNNVNAHIVLGRGAALEHHYGASTPEFNVFTGNVIRLNLVVGGVTLNIHMREDITVLWQWRCIGRPCGAIP